MDCTEKKRQRRRAAGFSLGEVLAALAILVILFAVGVPNVQAMLRSARQTSLDKKAELMYTALTRNLKYAEVSGNQGLLIKYSPDKNLYDMGEHTGYMLTNRSDSGLLELLLPAGSISADYYVGNWLALYDPGISRQETITSEGDTIYTTITAESPFIICVYYAEDGCSISEAIEQGNEPVGYYGYGESGIKRTVTREETGSLTCWIDSVENGEELTATLKCDVPNTAKYQMESLVTFYLTLANPDNGSEKYTLEFKKTMLLPGEVTYVAVLDSLAEGQQFANITNYQLTPGENYKLSLSVKCGNDEVFDTTKHYINSLFASSDRSGGARTVEVTCGRHLQNLSRSYSGWVLADGECATVYQKEDIRWEGRTFQSIENEDGGIREYHGEYQNFNYSITGLKTTGGLFQTFSGTLLSGITLVNPVVAPITRWEGSCGGIAGIINGNDANVRVRNISVVNPKITDAWFSGGIAGIITGEGVTVSNCSVTLEGSGNVISGMGSVGGLAGQLNGIGTGVKIEGCSVALEGSGSMISGTGNAGGIAGAVSGYSTLSKCHAYSGGSTSPICGAEYTGGLVGLVAEDCGLAILDSWADCYLSGNCIGGLVGKGDCTFTSCVSAGFVLGTAEDAADDGLTLLAEGYESGPAPITRSGFTNGSATLYGDCYSLFNFDDAEGFGSDLPRVGEDGVTVMTYAKVGLVRSAFGIAETVYAPYGAVGYFCYGGAIAAEHTQYSRAKNMSFMELSRYPIQGKSWSSACAWYAPVEGWQGDWAERPAARYDFYDTTPLAAYNDSFAELSSRAALTLCYDLANDTYLNLTGGGSFAGTDIEAAVTGYFSEMKKTGCEFLDCYHVEITSDALPETVAYDDYTQTFQNYISGADKLEGGTFYAGWKHIHYRLLLQHGHDASQSLMLQYTVDEDGDGNPYISMIDALSEGSCQALNALSSSLKAGWGEYRFAGWSLGTAYGSLRKSAGTVLDGVLILKENGMPELDAENGKTALQSLMTSLDLPLRTEVRERQIVARWSILAFSPQDAAVDDQSPDGSQSSDSVTYLARVDVDNGDKKKSNKGEFVYVASDAAVRHTDDLEYIEISKYYTKETAGTEEAAETEEAAKGNIIALKEENEELYAVNVNQSNANNILDEQFLFTLQKDEEHGLQFVYQNTYLDYQRDAEGKIVYYNDKKDYPSLKFSSIAASLDMEWKLRGSDEKAYAILNDYNGKGNKKDYYYQFQGGQLTIGEVKEKAASSLAFYRAKTVYDIPEESRFYEIPAEAASVSGF